MLHANVNYTASLPYVAYDTTRLTRAAIERLLRWRGVRLLSTPKAFNFAPATAVFPDEIEPFTKPQVHVQDEYSHSDTSHDEHAGQNHGSPPAFLPHWVQERWTHLLILLAELFLLIGWGGEILFHLPPAFILPFYLLAYSAGGYDIATYALPGLMTPRSRCRYSRHCVGWSGNRCCPGDSRHSVNGR